MSHLMLETENENVVNCIELPTEWLNHHECILLQFWRSEIQNRFHWANIKVLAGLCSCRKLQSRTYSLLFPDSHLHSLIYAPASSNHIIRALLLLSRLLP